MQETPIFLKACRREPVSVTPVWFMRQAGRYMKSYREIRKKTPFLELCKTPELAAEAAVSAAERLGVDAAILFSDILLLPEAMGMQLEFPDKAGPVFHNPIREADDLKRLREPRVEESMAFVYEAVEQTRHALPARTPLIGFAGAPFTLAAYMLEGKYSRSFGQAKSFMYRDPGAWHALMERLCAALAPYLCLQVKAGAQALQLFDSWAGHLGPSDYKEFVLPHVKKLVAALPEKIPVIYFGVGTGPFLHLMKDCGAQVIGVDHHVEIGPAWKVIGDSAVQGNLDPCVLLSSREYLQKRAKEILEQVGKRSGHIFNLGHGIMPQTPEENAVALVDFVHEISEKLRQ
ncbi:MAG: uroporphyrinogen decarboxylase [Acidobacteriota bacterium]|nr:MAG: uroporphyrinogen decarboxylase [Acidobacteriota bacterium]